LKQLILFVILATPLFGTPASEQIKVAEGEFHMLTGDSDQPSKISVDHWILYTRKQGGYRLESEVTAAAGTGVIVIQTEELDEQLNPTVINIRLYTHENTKKPFSSLACHLSAEQITCKAGDQELSMASDADLKGPVLFAVSSLEHIDLMWMMSGAINRAHFADNKVALPTLVLQDGEDGPQLAQTEVGVLHEDGKADLEIHGTKVSTRRYSVDGSRFKCWLSDSGMPLRMENEAGAVIELGSFKQYRKLVPELPVTN